MAYEFTRQELYDLLWSKPKTEVAKSLGISDVALGKLCKKAHIPVPPRGYWAREEKNRPNIKIALPLRGIGQREKISIGRDNCWHSNEPIGDLPSPPAFSEPIEKVTDRVRKLLGKVTVPKSLDRLHPLVAKLLEQDSERVRLFAKDPYSWNRPKFELAPAKRRVRLINAIFLSAARAGFRPDCRGKEAEQLYLHVGDVVVNFVVEPLKKSHSYDSMFDTNQTSPRLPLKIVSEGFATIESGIASQWVDTDQRSLESVFNEIVVNLIVLGEVRYRAAEEHRYKWLCQRKLEQEEAVRKAKQLAEQRQQEVIEKWKRERQALLVSQAKDWKLAREIREFVAAVMMHPDAIAYPDELNQWAKWACSEADSLDPLCSPISALFNHLNPP